MIEVTIEGFLGWVYAVGFACVIIGLILAVLLAVKGGGSSE